MNYQKELEIKINNLSLIENNYTKDFSNIPKNEKLLRDINREQEIKEALFLLLLQKREEAAINFAVTKPSIKIVDYASTNFSPVSPNTFLIYMLAFLLGIGIPLIIIFIWISLDDKIHTKSHLEKYFKNAPVVGEIPYLKDAKKVVVSGYNDRSVLAEGFRMLIANIGFIDIDTEDKCKVIMSTSTIKGEGKTFVALNLAISLQSKEKKVLLIGADLRNPQIHNLINVNRSEHKGLADFLYEKNDWKQYLIKDERFDNNADILLSGTIPPNPTEILSSEFFQKLIDEAKSIYDYIIIDSAPCLLVSDTYMIKDSVNLTLYTIRSNHSRTTLNDFINENINENKLPKISLVLNAVGTSHAYGYKYGYQYGYKYGYKYGYNYGYGYGYSGMINLKEYNFFITKSR